MSRTLNLGISPVKAVALVGLVALASGCGGGGGNDGGLIGPALGALDFGFSGDGKTTVSFGASDTANAVALQADGKLVVVGTWAGGSPDFAIARYNTDGTLDATFGNLGLTNLTFGLPPFGGEERATCVAIQPDGKIVVGGYTDATGVGAFDFAVCRLATTGVLDVSFDGDGRQTIDFGDDDRALGIALQADGKIVLAGQWDGGASNIAVVRLTTAGAPDPTFDGDGKADIGLGAVEIGTCVAIQSDGAIVVGGYSDQPGTNDFVIVRFTTGGAPDLTFDTDAVQTVSFGHDDRVQGIVIQPDGKIVVAGSWDGGSANMAIARLTTGGALDATFDGDGKQNVNFGAQDFGRGVALQADGMIVVAGFTDNVAPNDFAVARLTTGGALDAGFSGDGMFTIDFGGSDVANAVLIQPDGAIVMVGGTAGDFAIARIH